MAFFSEVKAKLGLDISPFERGLKQAQNSAGGLAQGIGKQFASTEKIAGALAAAIGLNMQGIADNIARLFSGFSKDAEAQLDDLVAKTEEAARKQEAALAASQRRIAEAREQATEAVVKDANDRISAQDRLRDRERSAILEQLDDEGKLAYLKGELADLQDILVTAEQDSVRQSELKIAVLDRESEIRAVTARMQEAANAKDEEARQKQKKAEEDRTKELEKQRDAMVDQRDAARQTLADYAKAQRKGFQPTTDDVRSGKRNIGSGARRQVSELDRLEARARQLSDAEERKREQLRNPNLSEGDRRRITEEGRKIYNEREAIAGEGGRIEKLKGGLSSRVSDIATNKQSLDELKLIQQGIKDLNQKLEPTKI